MSIATRINYPTLLPGSVCIACERTVSPQRESCKHTGAGLQNTVTPAAGDK